MLYNKKILLSLAVVLLLSCTDHVSSIDMSGVPGASSVVAASSGTALSSNGSQSSQVLTSSAGVGGSSIAQVSSGAALSSKAQSSAAQTSSVAASSGATSSAVVSSSVVNLSSSAALSSAVLASSSSGACTASSNGVNTLTDCRDAKIYKTVLIGAQTWMAENLNFASTTGSWCYSGAGTNCTTYGRLYSWNVADTVCPSGWHLPDTTEWSTLEASVGGASTAGTNLKAASGWTGTFTDSHGFTALPAGYDISGTYYSLGVAGYWWTANTAAGSKGYYRLMSNTSTSVGGNADPQTYGFSVRCLAD